MQSDFIDKNAKFANAFVILKKPHNITNQTELTC